MKTCVTCGTELHGKRRRFCSLRCKNADTNFRHQSYLQQQVRGRRRKLELIRLFGGRCARCGYHRNHAALEFHHTRPGSKSFQLDLRSLSNRSWKRVLLEAAKCILVCGNCHAEIHNPECEIRGVAAERADIKDALESRPVA